MGIGVSIFLIAVGAILAFAVTTSGIDLSTVGVILMAVGAVGLIVAIVVMNGWAWGGPRTSAVVEDQYGDPAPWRRAVRRGTYVD